MKPTQTFDEACDYSRPILIGDVASILQCSEDRVLNAVNKGVLPAANITGKFLFRRAAVDDFVKTYGLDFEEQITSAEIQDYGFPLFDSNYIREKSIKAPIFCGIYFLVRGKQIVYVGQSRRILKRLGDHIPEKKFDSYFFIKLEEEFLDVAEKHYITMFNPIYNITLNQRNRIRRKGANKKARVKK